MRRLHEWISPVPNPLGGDGRWWSGHHLSGREPSSPRYYSYANRRCHVGLDIAGTLGDPIVAPDDGIVTDWGYNSGAGYYPVVRHQVRQGRNTLTVWSRHLHCLSDQLVHEGDVVKQGEIIALLGSTGSSMSPHNHTQIMLTPSLPDWHDLTLFLDPEPIYYPGRSEFMQTGHPFPNEVRKVQRRLNALGVTPPLIPDGVYGPATVNAVKWFQHRAGIEEHGACSELCLSLLFAAKGKEL
jgi:murein DD-endopeptidase MepM/ murein hydrolase activator NlpD